MFGIRSIPTVMLIKDGQALDGFAGALPEGQLREFLGRHVQPTEPAPAVEDAPVATESPAQTIERLQQEIAAQPDNAGLKLDLATALMLAGQTDAAAALLDALPANLAVDARAVRLRSQLELAATLAGAADVAALRARIDADPNDAEARDQLGVRLLLEDDPAAGLDQFIELLKTHREWNDGKAKKRLLAAFLTLDDAELVSRYRRKMASLLF
jgi:putative thioredoxin